MPLFAWWQVGIELTLLTAEAQRVIALRLLILAAGGPTAQVEVSLMPTEKFLAAAGAAWAMGLGYPAHTILRGYRRHVRANLERLQPPTAT